ncbi:Aste57867_17190 [Aphanomyces stellatus]|uniref:Aste57867_17190 protein n=1 Tax=Aphanomyces stellatus TaxID=120398 RepID=A0A485L8J7_9STRA|nr:hypothetical protein As57867_017131 [Aphanomyces stellatus]VFT93947.1 Aste57867_17190 [Aphanomyces stellatus]
MEESICLAKVVTCDPASSWLGACEDLTHYHQTRLLEFGFEGTEWAHVAVEQGIQVLQDNNHMDVVRFQTHVVGTAAELAILADDTNALPTLLLPQHPSGGRFHIVRATEQDMLVLQDQENVWLQVHQEHSRPPKEFKWTTVGVVSFTLANHCRSLGGGLIEHVPDAPFTTVALMYAAHSEDDGTNKSSTPSTKSHLLTVCVCASVAKSHTATVAASWVHLGRDLTDCLAHARLLAAPDPTPTATFPHQRATTCTECTRPLRPNHGRCSVCLHGICSTCIHVVSLPFDRRQGLAFKCMDPIVVCFSCIEKANSATLPRLRDEDVSTSRSRSSSASTVGTSVASTSPPVLDEAFLALISPASSTSSDAFESNVTLDLPLAVVKAPCQCRCHVMEYIPDFLVEL